MSNYILEKQRNCIKVYSSSGAIEDTYNKINLRAWYIKKYNLNVPSLIAKSGNPELYTKLDKLVDRVNLFKPRVAVPNKLVDWGEPNSTSILIRRGGKIEIGRRTSFGKSGINIIPISNAEKNGAYGFFSDAKRYCGEDGYEDPVYGGHHYYVPEGTHEYDKWANWMNEKYNKLTNYAFVNKEKPKPLELTLRRSKLIESLELTYGYFGGIKSSELMKEWAEVGLCKVSNDSKFIYDKNGYFIMESEEIDERDTGEAFITIEKYLDEAELMKAIQITSSHYNSSLLGD